VTLESPSIRLVPNSPETVAIGRLGTSKPSETTLEAFVRNSPETVAIGRLGTSKSSETTLEAFGHILCQFVLQDEVNIVSRDGTMAKYRGEEAVAVTD